MMMMMMMKVQGSRTPLLLFPIVDLRPTRRTRRPFFKNERGLFSRRGVRSGLGRAGPTWKCRDT